MFGEKIEKKDTSPYMKAYDTATVAINCIRMSDWNSLNISLADLKKPKTYTLSQLIS